MIHMNNDIWLSIEDTKNKTGFLISTVLKLTNEFPQILAMILHILSVRK